MYSLPTQRIEENAQLQAPIALRPQKKTVVHNEHEARWAPDWPVQTLWRREKSNEGSSVVHTTAKGLQGRRSNGSTESGKFSNQISYLRLCLVFIFFLSRNYHHHHHKHQGLGPLIRSVSKVTTALSNVSLVFQLFSFLVVCSSMISKGFGFVAFFTIIN